MRHSGELVDGHVGLGTHVHAPEEQGYTFKSTKIRMKHCFETKAKITNSAQRGGSQGIQNTQQYQKFSKYFTLEIHKILTSSIQSRGNQGTQSIVYNRCNQVGGRICRTAKMIFRVCHFSPTSNQESPAGACIWTQSRRRLPHCKLLQGLDQG